MSVSITLAWTALPVGDARVRAVVRRLLIMFAACLACDPAAGCSSSGGTGSSGTGGGNPSAAPPGPVVYPPKTIAQAQALAITGDASAIHVARSESHPFEGCQRPNVYATADAGLRGQALAAAELARFTDESALTAKCPAFLYVFHSASEIAAGGYTVGAVILDSGLLEVDTGGVASGSAFEIKQ